MKKEEKIKKEVDFLKSKPKPKRREEPDMGYMEWLDFKDRVKKEGKNLKNK